jgi:hypothetical protein
MTNRPGFVRFVPETVPFAPEKSNYVAKPTESGGTRVSIVRVGLSETKNFAEGYEAIFGKKKDEAKKPAKAAAKRAGPAKKKASRKK